MVSEGLSALKDEDIERLVRLIESLDSSTFDYLQLQVGSMKVTLGKGTLPMSAPAGVAPDAPSYAPPPRLVVETVATASPPPAQTKPPNKRATGVAPAGTIDIKSKIMG